MRNLSLLLRIVLLGVVCNTIMPSCIKRTTSDTTTTPAETVAPKDLSGVNRCAVLAFSAAQSIPMHEVDGIDEMFLTYFKPIGYQMVERSQIDRVISEQNFQRTNITEDQMVRLGELLNVSKVVVGKVSMLGGKYQVDVRVVDVQVGHDVATEGATVIGDYRTQIKNLAENLAAKISIIPDFSSNSNQLTQHRDTVGVIYGYLKVFPKEIGIFDNEPKITIRRLNEQAQYGYNNWRLPTNEELSLLRAEGYLKKNAKYMTLESKDSQGIVLLVTDGNEYSTEIKEVEAKKQNNNVEAERARKDIIRKAEREKRKEALRALGYVDLGLPSGTIWKYKNESGFYTYDQAVAQFGKKRLPTREQFDELKRTCKWIWNGNGYKVVGPSRESIVLPALGSRLCSGHIDFEGSCGCYWSSTPAQSEEIARCLYFNSDEVIINFNYRCYGQSVRLVK